MRSERGGGSDDTGQGTSLGFTPVTIGSHQRIGGGSAMFSQVHLASVSRTDSERVWGAGRDQGGPCLFSLSVRGGGSSEWGVSDRKKWTHMGQQSWGDPFECTNMHHEQGEGLGDVFVGRPLGSRWENVRISACGGTRHSLFQNMPDL